MGCCNKCPKCGTYKVIATLVVKKDLEDNKFIEQYYKYKCKECDNTWVKETNIKSA